MLQKIKNAVQGVLHMTGYHLAPHYPYEEEQTTAGRIVTWRENANLVSFFVVDEIDNVQQIHLQRRFYAVKELEEIAKAFRGGTFLDVGANVGNHSIYSALIMGVSKVISIEPNPAAYRILRVNIGLNGLHERMKHYPVGLSDAPGNARAYTPAHNLGGTELTADSSGPFELAIGDDLLQGERVDFIKIDTQGMEMLALRGLKQTIREHQPDLFVEVMTDNLVEFEAFLSMHGYKVESRFSPRPSRGVWVATSAPSSKMRTSSARTCTSNTRRLVVSGTL